jgi:hypothetical protein
MNFEDIPVEDIKYMLYHYGQDVEENVYLQGWNFILNNPNIKVPTSIVEWIKVYNLQNRFKDLPNEIVAKIFNELSPKELLNVCSLSAHFKSICDTSLVQTYKEKLKGYPINNINDINRLIYIYMVTELNDRVVVHEGGYYILDFNGKLHGTFYDLYEDKNVIETIEMNNAIGLSGHENIFYIFCSDGRIYENNYLMKTNLKNIIQVTYYLDTRYFLDMNGNVYKNGTKILSNIIKMVKSKRYILFLSNNGKVYSVHENEDVKLLQLENITDVYINGFLCCIVSYDKIYINKDFNSNATISDFMYVDEHDIRKISLADFQLIVLTKDGDAIKYGFFNYSLNDIKEPEIKEYKNVIDCKSENPNFILFLTKDNNLIYSANSKSEDVVEHIQGNIRLLGYQYVSINGNILFVRTLNGKFDMSSSV